jgi:pilus assembly protein CpaF
VLATNNRGTASAPNSAVSDGRFLRLKKQLHQHLIASMDLSAIATLSDEELRREVQRVAEDLCQRSSDLLSISEREQLVKEVLDETFGLGPLEQLMRDPSITDILINGPRTVYVERNGVLQRTNICFNDDRHLMQIIQRIVGRVGRRVDETVPMVDARLADGSRFNAIIPPAALDGPLVSIRRFGTRPFTIDDLLAHQSITPEMVQFLSACVRAKVNMIFSGGTGSGKTTLLNALSASISPGERVATIEDAAELRLQQPHVVRMETRPPNIEGVGEITTRDLVRNSLRMRPDRIIIGEVRGGEALDMLQAMNTGHEGSMTTIHANDTRDALTRLEMMVGLAGVEVPIWIIRRQIASSIHLIVQASRLLGGPRKVVRISEITGMEGDIISLHDIFAFKQTGIDQQGVAQGYFHATGLRPHCLQRLAEAGIHLPYELFEQRILTPPHRPAGGSSREDGP